MIQSECFCEGEIRRCRSLLFLLLCKNRWGWISAMCQNIENLERGRQYKPYRGLFHPILKNLVCIFCLSFRSYCCMFASDLKYLSLPPLPPVLIRGPIFSAAPGWGCLVAPLPGLTGPQIAHLCTWALQTLGQALGNLESRSMGRR